MYARASRGRLSAPARTSPFTSCTPHPVNTNYSTHVSSDPTPLEGQVKTYFGSAFAAPGSQTSSAAACHSSAPPRMLKQQGSSYLPRGLLRWQHAPSASDSSVGVNQSLDEIYGRREQSATERDSQMVFNMGYFRLGGGGGGESEQKLKRVESFTGSRAMKSTRTQRRRGSPRRRPK